MIPLLREDTALGHFPNVPLPLGNVENRKGGGKFPRVKQLTTGYCSLSHKECLLS